MTEEKLSRLQISLNRNLQITVSRKVATLIGLKSVLCLLLQMQQGNKPFNLFYMKQETSEQTPVV